jgi:hypothetical protein
VQVTIVLAIPSQARGDEPQQVERVEEDKEEIEVAIIYDQ